MAGGLNDLELETLEEINLSQDEEPEIVTPAITRRRLRGGGGASWWARLLRRLAEATY